MILRNLNLHTFSKLICVYGIFKLLNVINCARAIGFENLINEGDEEGTKEKPKEIAHDQCQSLNYANTFTNGYAVEDELLVPKNQKGEVSANTSYNSCNPPQQSRVSNGVITTQPSSAQYESEVPNNHSNTDARDSDESEEENPKIGPIARCCSKKNSCCKYTKIGCCLIPVCCVACTKPSIWMNDGCMGCVCCPCMVCAALVVVGAMASGSP